MQRESAIAIIPEDIQNDTVSALHAAGVGHLARVIRKERSDIREQLARAGINHTNAPEALADAQRVIIVNAAHRSQEVACLLLQRGATSSWIVTVDAGWQPVDDEAIEIAATRDLPPRPVPPHRSSRTFRRTRVRRRHHRRPDAQSPG